ncbi:hypothetical protein S40285_00673 [Stachybotrys chlorohalonatus IBT 40285]|uniref:Uncharacterized protein n=1 Tax=Stachybotrys chlorohalonatus (strain IBT 40285) TaxID=1283841 RepID=A0A084QRC9_STAC4|nr:hypothetical protein S40285_00673 [Stachybotrys chlorohalonata IBT 40285]
MPSSAMEITSEEVPRLSSVIPKDNARANLNPPPYTQDRGPEDIMSVSSNLFWRHPRDPTASTVLLQGGVHDDDGDLFDGISLRVNTAINITNSNNLICLSGTPADHANAIARAVVEAINKNSSGQCGLPMINENGEPRPVRLEIDAGIVVEGAGNIIGTEDIILQVIRERASYKRRRAGAEADADGDVDTAHTAESSEMGAKRRRPSQ